MPILTDQEGTDLLQENTDQMNLDPKITKNEDANSLTDKNLDSTTNQTREESTTIKSKVKRKQRPVALKGRSKHQNNR